jgi:hypothetical protein
MKSYSLCLPFAFALVAFLPQAAVEVYTARQHACARHRLHGR